MLRTYKVEALVLKRIKKGESDCYYTLLTRYHGLLRVLARGIRKINSRRAPFLDLFNHIFIFLAKGKSFDVVTDVSPIDIFVLLKSDLNKVASAFKLAELTERLLPQEQPHPQIFAFLLDNLKKLNEEKTQDGNDITEKYSLFLLHNLGYLPHSEILRGKNLDQKLEEIMERKIKTNSFLSKLV